MVLRVLRLVHVTMVSLELEAVIMKQEYLKLFIYEHSRDRKYVMNY